MLAKLRPFIGLGLLVLLLLFILFNLDTVTIRFFPRITVQMPAAFVILFSAALGAGAVYALRFLKIFKKKEKT